MKEAFHWDEHFITGLPEVDDQHLHLVKLINKFGEQLLDQHIKVPDIKKLLNELKDYAHYHFDEEEKLMHKYKLDKRHIEAQEINHHYYLEQVLMMSEQFEYSERDVSQELLDFLCHWLAFHILGQDQIMAKQVKLINKGDTPGQAFETVIGEMDNSTEPLLNALNGLFDLVSERNKDLEAFNRKLEKKVKERTSQLEEANEKLKALSLTDVLTSLPNRRHAIEKLSSHWDKAIINNKPLSCMMIDADHFKEVNDLYGHDSGDIVLKKLALTLQHSIRSDDFVARLGGDEFFIICPDTGLKGASFLAESIRKSVDELNVVVGNGHWESGISIGVAEKSSDIHNYESLIKMADDSLYQAKMSGKNCVRSKQEISILAPTQT